MATDAWVGDLVMKLKGDLKDYEEFGYPDDAEDAKQCIARLISLIPPEKREAYRQERREALARIRGGAGLPPCTWAEHLQATKRVE